MKNLKIITLLLIVVMLLSSSVFAFNKDVNSDKKVTKKEVLELLEKYNITVINEDEAKKLSLDKVKPKEYGSIEEIEKMLIDKLEELKTPIAEEYHISMDVKTSEDDPTNVDSYYVTTPSVTYQSVTRSHTSTPLTDMTLYKYVGATVKIEYIPSPSEDIILSKQFISCNNGTVIQTSPPGYNRLKSITSSICKITSPTTIQHTYSGTYDAYSGIPLGGYIIYIYIGTNTISGNVSYVL